VETAPTLSTIGGVLTPKGQIVIDPSIEYDYWAQNQLGVNGFQIIPGITFGNIFVTRFGCRGQMHRTSRMRIFGFVTPLMQRRAGSSATALLIGGVYFVSPLGAALADDTAEDLRQLRAAIQKELADLKKREQKPSPTG
jgi:hypothetical protein